MKNAILELRQDAARTGSARVGIGGPVGSGKTALIERLIPVFHDRGIAIAIVTNDLVTAEDAFSALGMSYWVAEARAEREAAASPGGPSPSPPAAR